MISAQKNKRANSRFFGVKVSKKTQQKEVFKNNPEDSTGEAEDEQAADDANTTLVSALKSSSGDSPDSKAEKNGRGKLSRVSFKEDLEQQLHDPGLGSNLIPEHQQEIALSSERNGEGLGTRIIDEGVSTITKPKEEKNGSTGQALSSEQLTAGTAPGEDGSGAAMDPTTTTTSTTEGDSQVDETSGSVHNVLDRASDSYADKMDKYFEIFENIRLIYGCTRMKIRTGTSGTQPSNDSFNMFGRRYKKWAYLHWTLNANTTAADWAVVLLENAPANDRVLDEIAHNLVDDWQQISLSEITGVYLEVAPSAAFRLYRDTEVLQFTPVPQSTVAAAEWADAVYSALQIQIRPAEELWHFRDLYFSEMQLNARPNPVAVEVLDNSAPEPSSDGGDLTEIHATKNEIDSKADAEVKSKGSMKSLLRKLKDVALFRSKKLSQPSSSESNPLPLRGQQELEPATSNEVAVESEESPSKTVEEQADFIPAKKDYSKEGVLVFCQDVSSDDDDDDDDGTVVPKSISHADDKDTPIQQRSIFRKYSSSAPDDQSDSSVVGSVGLNPILLMKSNRTQPIQEQPPSSPPQKDVLRAPAKPLLGKKTVLDIIFARPVVVLIPDSAEDFINPVSPEASGIEDSAPQYDSRLDSKAMSSRDFLMSPYQPKHDMFDSVEWLGVNMTGDTSLRVPATRIVRKEKKSVTFAGKEKKDPDISPPKPVTSAKSKDSEPKSSSPTMHTSSNDDVNADLETKLQQFLRSPGSSFPRNKSGNQLLQSLEKKTRSPPKTASLSLSPRESDPVHGRNNSNRTQRTRSPNQAAKNRERSPTASRTRYGSPYSKSPQSARGRGTAGRYKRAVSMEAPISSRSDYIFDYEVSDVNNDDDDDDSESEMIRDGDLRSTTTTAASASKATTTTTTAMAAPKQASSRNANALNSPNPPASTGYGELKSASAMISHPQHNHRSESVVEMESLLVYLRDHTVACSAVYSPDAISYIKLDYLKGEKKSKIILLRDITSVDIDTNGTGLFRIVHNIATANNASTSDLSPDSNDDISSRVSNNNGNYSRRKRKVKGVQELPTSTSTSTPQHDRNSSNSKNDTVVEQRQLVMTSAIPSQLSLWLDRLRQYRHLDTIS